jgi:predicted aldo/keto reductase-like oxidoreductase
VRTSILGRSGLEVVRIGCGGIPIISEPFDNAVAVVRAALDAGVNYFDNARAYGDSESKMGKALEGRRDEIILATKTHARDAKTCMEHLETSLTDLRTDRFDIWQLHDISSSDRWEEAMAPGGALEAAKQAQQQGKTRFIGLSSHNPVYLKKAIECGEFDTILLTYNIASRWMEPEILPLAKARNVGVAVMKPLSGGAILDVPEQETGEHVGVTPEEGLRFVLSHDAVNVALSGFKRVHEVPQNMAVLDDFKPITAEERQRLIEFGDKMGQVFCRRCTYCMPCGEGIDIPKTLAILDHIERFPYEWPSNRRRYHELEVKPDACIECGECEERCPFDVPIIERLKKAKEKLDQPV